MTLPVQLPGFVHDLARLPDLRGYLATGLALVAEDLPVPSPGGTVLVPAPVWAGAGRLSIVAVGQIGCAAAVPGDDLWHAIGRFGGRTPVFCPGSYVLPGAGRRRPCRAARTRPAPGHRRGRLHSRLVPRWRAAGTAWSAS